VLLVASHLHELAVRRNGLEADHLIGNIGGPTADSGAQTRRSNGATQRPLHFFVAADQFETMLRQFLHERADAHTGLCRDGIVDDVHVADAI
jgi:hypothetical protein